MTTFEIVILSLIQGITEFLPVSSSAHLILPARVFGWDDQGLAFDVAVHVGSLLAVLLYFRKDVMNMLVAWTGSLAGKGHSKDSRLAWYIILGTIPAGLAGAFGANFIENNLRSPMVIAITTVTFGLLLGWAAYTAKETKDEYMATWKEVLFIGLAQALALIPGTSRSGITMTAALMMGYTRKAAARFSFLLSIPLITAAGLLQTYKLTKIEEVVQWDAIFMGVVLSFVSALACIHFFLKLIERMGMAPFVIYRLCLGAFLVYFLI